MTIFIRLRFRLNKKTILVLGLCGDSVIHSTKKNSYSMSVECGAELKFFYFAVQLGVALLPFSLAVTLTVHVNFHTQSSVAKRKYCIYSTARNTKHREIDPKMRSLLHSLGQSPNFYRDQQCWANFDISLVNRQIT